MEKFNLEYFDRYAEERRIINEATSESLNKEIYTEFGNLFAHLSDVFSMQNKKGDVTGAGNASDFLRKAEVSIQKIKEKVKSAGKIKGDEKFDSNMKKVLGELSTSLDRVSERITNVIVPSIVSDVQIQAPSEPTEEEPTFDDEELPPVKEESVKQKRRTKIF
jgi:hypothetical protein